MRKRSLPDPALIAYYERGRRQNKKHRSFRFTKSGCQKQYMRPNLFGISQEFQGFISQTPAMSAICEMNKFMVDFRRHECNIGKFAFGVPRFIHGTLQEIPFWLVGEILDEDEWTFIIGSGKDGKNGRAFDKDASIYSTSKSWTVWKSWKLWWKSLKIILRKFGKSCNIANLTPTSVSRCTSKRTLHRISLQNIFRQNR